MNIFVIGPKTSVNAQKIALYKLLVYKTQNLLFMMELKLKMFGRNLQLIKMGTESGGYIRHVYGSV